MTPCSLLSVIRFFRIGFDQIKDAIKGLFQIVFERLVLLKHVLFFLFDSFLNESITLLNKNILFFIDWTLSLIHI